MTNKIDEQYGLQSDLTLGYYDRAKFKGDIQWLPIMSDHMFAVKLDDILINGKSLNLCSNNKKCNIAFDSGSTFMSMPSFAHEILNKNQIPT